MSANVKVYINPLDDTGAYSGFQEVTADVDFNSLTRISRKLDASDFDVGVFVNNSITLKLRNSHGEYSEPGEVRSIFGQKRNDSLVKIEWYPASDEPILGAAVIGTSVLGPAVEVFKGFLSDDNMQTDARTQDVSFTVRGMESLFDRVETNYASLSSGSTETLIYDLLNQTGITTHLTVSSGNISLPDDQNTDTIADLENTTVKEALDDLLDAMNAVLYIESDTVYVQSRDASAATPVTFYGQAAADGIESVVSIKNIKSGRSKMFNYWTWEDTTLKSTSTSDIEDYGVKKKELGFSYYTNNTKRQAILDEHKTEFSAPKREMKVTVPATYDALDLQLLDRINVDYPSIYMPAEPEEGLPLYGVAVYGTDKYPLSQWSLNLTTAENFKIIGIENTLKDNTVTLTVKEV